MEVVRTPLPPQPSSVPAARRFVRQATSRDPPELAEVAELLVAELVGNAVKHARTPLTLQVEHEPSGDVRLRVRDGSAALPARKENVVERSDGYGLHFVEALAAEWGTAVEPGDGKTVWCLIRRPRRAAT
jgi:two-component sensor histidine kinase